MTKMERARSVLAKAVEVLFFLVAGAWFLIWYIEVMEPTLAPHVKHLGRAIGPVFWILLIFQNYLNSSSRNGSDAPENSPPRLSGVFVVLAVGLASAFLFWRSSGEGSLVLAIVTAGATVIVAGLVWRFATKHASDIGEARFAPSGLKDTPANGG
ncbi:hypothetical protein [Sphingobium sp. DN12]|uniref:hypothetical protein n=1 Tax=Sphingobium sp. DN12 TaxID=3378073 RepID=UPI003DA5086D